MELDNTTPYTYLIGWPEQNLWYYGVRYAKHCNPSDLWNPYTTSSVHVDNAVQHYGIPPVRLIRKTFTNSSSARLWESRVLKRMNVVKDSRWLNKTDTKVFEPMYGDLNPMRRPEVAALVSGDKHGNKKLENKLKISNSHKSKGELHHTKSLEFKEKVRQSMLSLGENHPMKHPDRSGNNHPMKRTENRLKAKENNTGSNNPMFGKTQKKKFCCYCQQNISVNTFSRYHGENCKKNSTV